MKTFCEIICLLGILTVQLKLCSADKGSSEAELKKIYKLSRDIIDDINYKIIKGEVIKEPTKKVWMKLELNTSYVSTETEVFNGLKKGKKDLLSAYIADMLDHGTYENKKVSFFPSLGDRLREYNSEAYSWDELSKIGPCMMKALRLLHDQNYVHRNLRPGIFAFGTEQKVAPLKNKVYLFDIGLAEKYRHSNGSHKVCKKINEPFRDVTYASLGAMKNMTQSRRDDIESIFYVLSNLAGFTSPFSPKKFKDFFNGKAKFVSDPHAIKKIFLESKIKEVRVCFAFIEFWHSMNSLFNAKFETEPEYDALINSFDQGLSEEEIKTKYKFDNVKTFESKSEYSVIGFGNTTDPKNKMEAVMKLVKNEVDQDKVLLKFLVFKTEIRIYNDLKKGLKHSLLRENICDMLDHGIYDNRRAIIMPRLGLDWFYKVAEEDSENEYPYDDFCIAARQAISALKFLHRKGYIHRDLKLDNFAFGSVDANKTDKSQADKPLKTRLYLFDFGLATNWRFANNTHRPRVKINIFVGTLWYLCRTAILKYSQSRRDDMESLFLALAVGVTKRLIFKTKDKDERVMWENRNNFITKPKEISKTFEKCGIADKRTHKAFEKYATELNKLFVSDEPEYYEKEPDYNAFCVCFGGKPGDKACDVD